MEMVSRDQRRALQLYGPILAAASGGLGNAAMDGLQQIARQAGTAAKNTIRQRGRAAQQSRKGGKSRKLGPSNKPSGPSGGTQPGFRLTTAFPAQPTLNTGNAVRLQLKDVFAVANGVTTGVASSAIPLAVNTNQTLTPLGTFIPRLTTISGLYRQFYINRITFSFVPNSGDATGGSIAIAVDPEPLAGAPTTFGSVVRHRSAFFTDIKAPAMLSWTAKQDGKDKKMVVNNLVNRDEDALSFGVLQIYSSNTVTANTNIGNIMVMLDVTFIGPL
jgi:hypothetical protein